MNIDMNVIFLIGPTADLSQKDYSPQLQSPVFSEITTKYNVTMLQKH